MELVEFAMFCYFKQTNYKHESAQSVVEAAFIIPVVMLLILLMLQPAIILYDRIVMNSAAGEACRLLATQSGKQGSPDNAYKQYVIRQLGAIPPVDIFPVHKPQCSWDIILEGNENLQEVKVTIKNKIKLLPLLGMAASLMDCLDADGLYTISVDAKAIVQPDWLVNSNHGLDPDSWMQEYKD